MQWNNMYLLPIVLVGGLIAFFFGRTIVGRLLYAFSRLTSPAAKPVDLPQQSFAPSASPPAPLPPRMESRRSPIRLLAERKEEWENHALSVEDEREALADRMRALDLEEARRAALREEYRKASKSTHALVGKLDVDPTAGPLTTAMAMTDAVQEMLRAARDSNPPKS